MVLGTIFRQWRRCSVDRGTYYVLESEDLADLIVFELGRVTTVLNEYFASAYACVALCLEYAALDPPC